MNLLPLPAGAALHSPLLQNRLGRQQLFCPHHPGLRHHVASHRGGHGHLLQPGQAPPPLHVLPALEQGCVQGGEMALVRGGRPVWLCQGLEHPGQGLGMSLQHLRPWPTQLPLLPALSLPTTSQITPRPLQSGAQL